MAKSGGMFIGLFAIVGGVVLLWKSCSMNIKFLCDLKNKLHAGSGSGKFDPQAFADQYPANPINKSNFDAANQNFIQNLSKGVKPLPLDSDPRQPIPKNAPDYSNFLISSDKLAAGMQTSFARSYSARMPKTHGIRGY